MGRPIKLLVIAALLGSILYIPMLFALPSPSGVQGYIGTEVKFSWGESSGVVDGYRIYWSSVAGGPYPNRLCEVTATTLVYIASLNSEGCYYLVCRAYNGYGESGNSNEVIWPIL